MVFFFHGQVNFDFELIQEKAGSKADLNDLSILWGKLKSLPGSNLYGVRAQYGAKRSVCLKWYEEKQSTVGNMATERSQIRYWEFVLHSTL